MTRIHCAALAAALLAAPAYAAEDIVYRWTDKAGQIHYSDQPPPAEVGAMDVKRLLRNTVETSTPSYATQRARADFPVTLYVSPDCGSACDEARTLLKARGVPYAEVGVAEEADHAKFKTVFGEGTVFVPAITVGKQKSKGLDKGSWTQLLDEAGYPKSAATR